MIRVDRLTKMFILFFSSIFLSASILGCGTIKEAGQEAAKMVKEVNEAVEQASEELEMAAKSDLERSAAKLLRIIANRSDDEIECGHTTEEVEEFIESFEQNYGGTVKEAIDALTEAYNGELPDVLKELFRIVTDCS